MNLILLSGNSIHNKDWIHDVAKEVMVPFADVYAHDYKHWDTDEPNIDMDFELEAVAHKAEKLTPYAIFAKSIGSVLTLKGMNEGALTPSACVFTGLPLAAIHKQNLPVVQWLKDATIPITIVQNDADPIGSYDEVLEYLGAEGMDNITVVKASGDSHNYTDFDLLKKLTAQMAD